MLDEGAGEEDEHDEEAIVPDAGNDTTGEETDKDAMDPEAGNETTGEETDEAMEPEARKETAREESKHDEEAGAHEAVTGATLVKGESEHDTGDTLDRDAGDMLNIAVLTSLTAACSKSPLPAGAGVASPVLVGGVGLRAKVPMIILANARHIAGG